MKMHNENDASNQCHSISMISAIVNIYLFLHDYNIIYDTSLFATEVPTIPLILACLSSVRLRTRLAGGNGLL